jgi:hypothetical protein
VMAVAVSAVVYGLSWLAGDDPLDALVDRPWQASSSS